MNPKATSPQRKGIHNFQIKCCTKKHGFIVPISCQIICNQQPCKQHNKTPSWSLKFQWYGEYPEEILMPRKTPLVVDETLCAIEVEGKAHQTR